MAANDLLLLSLQRRLIESLLEPEDETEKYESFGAIGSGAFGDVKKVREKSSGVLQAMKALEFDVNDKHNGRREILNIIRMGSHKNIVKLYDVFRARSNKLLIVMELCHMDLDCFLEVRENRNFESCLDIAVQISEGIMFLHTHNPQIIHRDVKPQNILILQAEHQTSVKLSDFGLSSCNQSVEIIENATSQQIKNAIRSMRTTSGHGTLPFMAPEIFAGRDGVGLVDGKFVFDATVDIFALGLVYLFMFCYNESDYVSLIKQGFTDGLGKDMYEANKNGDAMPEAVEFDERDSDKLKAVKVLILRMTSYIQIQRPSAADVHQQIVAMIEPSILAHASRRQWVKQGEAKINPFLSARVINQQLWCCCRDASIKILDTNLLQYQKTLPVANFDYVLDVAQLTSGDLVIAGLNGLFHSQGDGHLPSRINSTRWIPNVVVHEDNVYAATWFKPRRSILFSKFTTDSKHPSGKAVYIYKNRDNSRRRQWVEDSSFHIDINGCVTLSVRKNQIKCCSDKDNKIMVYSLNGELLHTYGSSGSASNGAGYFNQPLICSDDDDGNVLIADWGNDRLQVMSEQGEFSVLQLQPPVSRPRIAELFNGKLYVYSSNGNVYKYG